ncbi:MAG: YajQ family cyclic di-GMP-binding protein [Candidatus Firestonebacteria bacterium]
MPNEFSFDIVSSVNMQELDNAINQAQKELANRFDFKGVTADIKLDKEKKELTVTTADEFKMKSLIEILASKMFKRGISQQSLDLGKCEPAGGMTVRQLIKIKEGIKQEKGKEITKFIRDGKFKVNAQIQGEQLRIVSKSKDDLQAVMSAVKAKDFGLPLQYTNFR